MNNSLLEQTYQNLQIAQLIRSEAFEVLSISLEASCMFPEHISPKEAHLVLLEGEIYFGMDDQVHNLIPLQVFKIKPHTKHFVKALTNSKFLIIR